MIPDALLLIGVIAGIAVIVIGVPWWILALWQERRTYELMRSEWAPPDHPARHPLTETADPTERNH